MFYALSAHAPPVVTGEEVGQRWHRFFASIFAVAATATAMIFGTHAGTGGIVHDEVALCTLYVTDVTKWS